MPQLQTASRQLIEAHQLFRLQLGLAEILPHNAFYRSKFLQDNAPMTIERLEDLACLPFTTKRELVADQEQHPLFGHNHTYPLRAAGGPCHRKRIYRGDS